jgi:hypothetical protein
VIEYTGIAGVPIGAREIKRRRTSIARIGQESIGMGSSQCASSDPVDEYPYIISKQSVNAKREPFRQSSETEKVGSSTHRGEQTGAAPT